jgi:hypothetical protein
MRNLFLLVLPLLVSVFSTSCKKGGATPEKSPSTPVSFKTTQYDHAGTYDETGRPTTLLSPDQLSPDLLNYIQTSLPEAKDVSKTNPSFLSSNSDLNITQTSDVYITFVYEGAGELNTLGFYTYQKSSPPLKPEDIKKITFMFPNASEANSGGGLKSGDRIKIGTFDAGTSIGFALLERGWNATTRSVNTKATHFCSNEILNPENDPTLKKHTVLLNYEKEGKILIGFEDQNRTLASCDHDFNDILIYATIVPKT